MSMLEWQTTTTDAEVTKGRLLHITKEQRTIKSQSSKIAKHEGTKTKDYSTTTHNVKDKEHGRPNHVEHHSNDHPLGGDC
jgi:hypothetical protein